MSARYERVVLSLKQKAGMDTLSAAATGSGRALSQETQDRFSQLLVLVGKQRDRAAFKELFDFYAPRIKNYLVRLGADRAVAEDIAQDVMITVWRKADQFDPGRGSVSTWIFRIARNRRVDVHRSSVRAQLDASEPMFLPAEGPAPDACLAARDIERNVRLAMRDLPVEQFEVLKLAFYEGKSHREIALMCDLSLGTVKSRVRMAFRRLQRSLEGVAL